MKAQPKFKIGDKVTHKKDLYGLIESVVTEVIRTFKEVDAGGNFVQGGLSTLEDTISSTCIPYEFDGETFTVHYPEDRYGPAHSMVSKFYGYGYVTKNEKMNTIWQEKSLKLRN